MATTEIQWTQGDDGSKGMTWNPTTGCDRVSAGCDNCYALTMAARLKGMGAQKYQTDGDPRTSGPGFGLAMHPDALDVPLRWRKPRRVFVNSMSDLFHPKVTDDFIARVFETMALAEPHTFQVLTKRAPRMASLLNAPWFAERIGEHHWPLPNVWMGVSVEDQEQADRRIPRLMRTPAAVRFLSCEPLLEPVDLGFEHDCGDPPHLNCPPVPDWMIVGGESGPNARRMQLEWARSLVAQCRAVGVAPFVKQLGSVWGRSHHDIGTWPEDLRVREWPAAAGRVRARGGRLGAGCRVGAHTPPRVLHPYDEWGTVLGMPEALEQQPLRLPPTQINRLRARARRLDVHLSVLLRRYIDAGDLADTRREQRNPPTQEARP